MTTVLDQRTTVLLVEDEESFVDALVVGLQREGFRVQVARDGIEAVELFDRIDPDVILLDVMLPRMSGIDVCRQIRARSQVPIIMVTAKASEIDTVVGLEVGADDYVSKPYRLRELVARMRAAMRRVPEGRSAVVDPEADVLEVGDVRMDVDRHEVVIRDENVSLPLKEFELLELLLAIGLAGSLFFSISPEAARTRVALYLLLTMAPFAVVAPVLGPLIDRQHGGRRGMVVASLALRSVLCLLIADHIHGLLLFPLAF